MKGSIIISINIEYILIIISSYRRGGAAPVVELEFSTRSIFVTLVDSSNLTELLDAIKKANQGSDDNINVIAISPMDALIYMYNNIF